MAKESGIGMTVTIDDSAGGGHDVSTDIGSLSFSTPNGLLDVTGVDVAAMERIIGLQDGQVQITGFFDDDSNKLFDILKTRSGSRTVVIAISGQTLTMECLISDVTANRGNDGSFGWSATLQLSNGTAPAWT